MTQPRAVGLYVLSRGDARNPVLRNEKPDIRGWLRVAGFAGASLTRTPGLLKQPPGLTRTEALLETAERLLAITLATVDGVWVVAQRRSQGVALSAAPTSQCWCASNSFERLRQLIVSRLDTLGPNHVRVQPMVVDNREVRLLMIRS